MPSIQRDEPTGDPTPIPRPDPDQPQRVSVDATWGTLQPMQLADGVRTVGELEVIDHLEAGRPVVDSRLAEHHAVLTLPGAVSIPHPDSSARLDELDPATPTVFFCNGPQCGQSPLAIGALLEAGHPAEMIWYYRGGLHDWMTLGLPTVTPQDQHVQAR